MEDNGELCAYCAEPFSEHDVDWPRHRLNPDTEQYMHPMCLLRAVRGSVGHLRGLCSCAGGDVEDPPGLTRRQGALVAYYEYELTKDPYLRQYAVYFDPLDYPGLYVVRLWEIRPTLRGGICATDQVWTASTLDEARRYIPRGCARFGRDERDDPKIVEVWKDFSRRMALHAFPGRTERRRQRLLEEVNNWFDNLNVEDWENFGSWDHHSDDFECRQSARRFWLHFSRSHQALVVPAPYLRGRDEEYTGYCTDMVDSYFSEFIPDTGDADSDYEHAHFYSMICCCLRSGIDLAASPSAGVIGFTIGDVKRMYDGVIPQWICDLYEADLNAAEETKGIWL